MTNKLIKIAIVVLLAITFGLLMNAGAKDGFFSPFFEDSRIHSLDLEDLRGSPRQ